MSNAFLRERERERERERGYVLALILLAVALFAALSYAVTQSTRSGGGDASRETTQLMASEMMQYSAEIQNAIVRMKVSNGCTDTQISFDNPFVSGYTNSNAPANYSCHVFRPEGGSVVWKYPPTGASLSGRNYYFNGTMSFVGRTPSDTLPSSDAIDLIMGIQDIPPELCTAINQKVYGNGTSVDLRHINGDGAKFTGTYSWGHHMHSHSKDINALCITNTVSSSSPNTMTNKLHFIKILIPR